MRAVSAVFARTCFACLRRRRRAHAALSPTRCSHHTATTHDYKHRYTTTPSTLHLYYTSHHIKKHQGPADPADKLPWYRGAEWSFLRGGLTALDRDYGAAAMLRIGRERER